MVSDTVIGAVIGVSGAIIGSLVTGAFNWLSTRQRMEAERENLRIRQQAETERRRGEYYLQQKVEALMSLYAILEETRREYKKTADKAVYGEISQEEYDDVIDWYHKYERAMDRAAVFLSDEQHEILLEAFNKIHDTNSFLHRKVDNPKQSDYSEFGLSEYNDRFNTAEEMLKEEIRGPIEALHCSRY
ncbi:hypothetical protein [Salinilacihabitans rarus]|uniref:hypothetical protein n=1 Tax=Salinilacihabitans rarus TaxID=2961596 RepID=UPI0020C8F67D|nr:hypothetical protein [Salinilacihabitans rarus]